MTSMSASRSRPGSAAQQRVDVAVAAATAAAAALPAAAALEAGPPSTDPLVVVLPGKAACASFAGTVRGAVVAVVGQDLVDALASSPLGPLDLATAVVPALEAALATLGPVVLDPAVVQEPASALETLAAAGDAVFVPLHDGESVRAALALVLSTEPSPAVAEPPAAAGTAAAGRAGLDLLYEVEMDVTAELGRTRLTVRELLSLTPGSIVELDRLAGSPADLLVNGRLIASGEVVVIDENFGLRITDIVSPGEHGQGPRP